MIATGVPAGRQGPVRVLQPPQVSSPLRPRQGPHEAGSHLLSPRGDGALRRAGSQGCQARRASREALSSGIKDAPSTWAGRCRGPPHLGGLHLGKQAWSRRAAHPDRPPQPPAPGRPRLPPRPHGFRVASSRSPRPARPAQEEGGSAPAARPCRALTSSSLPPAAMSRRSRPKPGPAGPLRRVPSAAGPGRSSPPGTCLPLLLRSPGLRPSPGPAPSLPIGRGSARGVFRPEDCPRGPQPPLRPPPFLGCLSSPLGSRFARDSGIEGCVPSPRI